jgi:transmembrane sensor
VAASCRLKGADGPMGRDMAIDPNIIDAAADWHASLEGDAPDYDGFAAWLEADARHREAFDRVIAFDTLLADHAAALSTSMPANDDVPVSGGQAWRWSGIAAALALVVGIGTLTLRDNHADQIAIATKRGETQTIQLADTSAVTLDGNSSLTYAKGSERAILLASGSAHFAVKHDVAKPFSVAAGGYRIRDLGTEFSVSRASGHLTISVSSGLVEVDGPGVSRLSVRPGERLDISGEKFETSRIDPASVGSWRQGRLVYNNAPLRLVVADINRYARQPVQIDPAFSDRRFSGVLSIGDGSQLAPTVANLMAVPLRPIDDGARLGAGSTR